MTKRRRHGRHRRRRTDWVTIAVPAGAAILVIAVVVAVILTLRGCGGTAGAVSGQAGAQETDADVQQIGAGAQQVGTDVQPGENGTGAASGSPADETESGMETADSGEVQDESAVTSTVAAEAKDQTPAEEVAANPELGINFTEVNDTVTAKELTNLRTLPTTLDSEVVYQLRGGETVQRTGIGSNGWDRVIYNGQKLYAVHNFLTTDLSGSASGSGEGGNGADGASQSGAAETGGAGDSVSQSGGAAGGSSGDAAASGSAQADDGTSESAGMVFRDVSEAVTARDQVNLRDQPSTVTGNVVGTLNYGEAVVRTGISDSGWSRLEVNGQVVYASSRLLAASMDYKEQEKITDENPEAGMHFTAASGIMMAKSGQTNLRTLPTTNEPSQVVAQLTGDATAERIAEDKDRGWTKLIYNGQTVYAVSSYLTQVG